MTTADLGPDTLARIAAALSNPSRDATIHDVKRAVIDEFERVDRRVAITATDYFRHSFVPDLVLRWSDDVDRAERPVYLRSKVDSHHLLVDVETVAGEQPIIFGLVAPQSTSAGKGSPVSGEQTSGEVLQQRSTATGTLITDPQGLNALVQDSDNPAPVSSRLPDLVARQILRGGRGIYDEVSSRATTSTIRRGFSGALTTDPDATFKAAAAIRDGLGEQSGSRLIRLLHAMWIGGGGRSDLFPDAPSASGPLSDDALELLINGVDIEDIEFWRRLGPVTMSQLARLDVGDRPANLGRFIVAHADGIEGRWCRVRPDEPRTGSEHGLAWGIERGCVALHGPTFTAFLSPEKRGLAVEPVEQPGISLATLGKRAGRAAADVSDVTGSGQGLIIAVASETNDDLLANPGTSQSVGVASDNIRKATTTLVNGRVLLCDFTDATASSRTNATLTVRELVRHGVPLLWDLADDEMQKLDAMLAVVEVARSHDAQGSLFDAAVDAGPERAPAEDEDDEMSD